MSDVLPPDEGRTYDAFVSYSHAADKPLADAIQRGLHRFAKPWYKLRALRVFRDDTSLSANPALWDSIEQALSESRWFILFASEPAANSEWVSREVATWCAEHATERVLIVQTDGEIEWDRDRGDFDWDRTTALPRIMDGRFGEEPRHIDMRWARHGQELDSRDPRLRDSVAELAAPLHGLPKDDLYGEDHRQHKRARRMARGGVSALMALLVALGFTTVFAIDQRNEATQQRDRALARQLAAQADALRDTRLDRSLLLALHSLEFADTVQGRDALLGSLQAGPLIERFLDRPTTTSAQAVFNSGGDLLGLQSSRGGDVFIEIWDSAGLEPVTEIVEDEAFGFVGGHAFSGSSGIIAVGWSNGATRLYDVQSGEPLTEPFGAGGDADARGLDADEQVARVVNALAFDSQGDRLVTGDGSGRIVEWNVVGDEPRRLNSVRVAALPPGVSGAAYLDDGQVVATGIGATVIWDPLERVDPPLGRLEPGPSPILSLNGSGPAVAADGRTVVAGGSLAGSDIEAVTRGSSPGVLVFWDREGSKSVPTGLPDPVSAIASSHDGEVLAVGDNGGNVSFWSARLRQRVDGPFHVHGARIDHLAFAPGDGTLVTSADDGQVAVLGVDISQPASGVRPRDRRLVEGSEESVFLPDALDVDASPDGEHLAVGLDNGDVVAWSPDPAQVVDRLGGDGRPATAVRFLDDETVLIGSDTGPVRRWRLGESRAEDLGLGGNDGVVSMAVSRDRTLVAVGTTGSFGVFEVATGRPVVGPIDVESGVEDVSFFPDGSAVATTHGDAIARWAITQRGAQEPVTVSVGHGGAFAVAVDPTGDVVAVGLWDGHMSFVDADTWKPIGEPIPAHADRVTAVTWTPDGRHLVTGAVDRRVRVWDGATRVMLGSSFDQTSIVTALAPLPFGRVAAADLGGQIQLWDVAARAWQREACLIVGRELTAAEFEQLIGPDLGVRRVCRDD